METIKSISVSVVLLLLGTSVLSAQETLSLQDIVRSALDRSHVLRQYDLQAQALQVDAQKAKEYYLPTVQLEGTYTHLNDELRFPGSLEDLLLGTQRLLIKEAVGIPFNGALPQGTELTPVDAIQEQDYFKANVNLQSVVYTGGQAKLLEKAAKAGARAKHLQAEQSGQQIIAATAELYDQLAVVQASRNVLQQTEELLNERERFLRAAIQNGLSSKLPLQEVLVARQELESRKLELSTSEELILVRLSQLSGYPMEQLRGIQPKLQVPKPVANTDNSDARKDIQALDQAIKASEYQEQAQWRNYVPKVFVYGRYELIENYLTLLDPRWYAGAGIRWTLFDGLQAKREVEQAKLEQLQLQEKRADATDLLQMARLQAKLNYDKASQQLTLARARMEQTEEILELSTKEYEAGLRTLADHLDSIQAVEKAQLDEVQAIFKLRRAQLARYEAAGILSIDLLNL